MLGPTLKSESSLSRFQRDGAEGRSEPGGELAAEPLADLMFTMIATVLLLLIAMFPSHSSNSDSAASDDAASLGRAPIVINHRRAAALVASQAGIELPQQGAAMISIDSLSEDAHLRSFLENLRKADAPLVVIVGKEGLESSFELEGVLAAYGPQTIYQVRLDRECQQPSGETPRTCGASFVSESDQ